LIAQRTTTVSSPAVIGAGLALRQRGAHRLLVLTLVASCHLSPAAIEDDIPHQFWITGRRVGRDLERLEYGPGTIEHLNQVVSLDALHTEHPIEPAEILNREFHPSIAAAFSAKDN
jgi:hypothetical protein